MERRWHFLKKLGHYYLLLFDEAMYTPPHVRIEGRCSTTKIPEEIGELTFYNTTLRGPSAEHFYFSEEGLGSVYSYDGFAPTHLEIKLGAVPVPIKNERVIDNTESNWHEYVDRLEVCLMHATNRRKPTSRTQPPDSLRIEFSP